MLRPDIKTLTVTTLVFGCKLVKEQLVLDSSFEAIVHKGLHGLFVSCIHPSFREHLCLISSIRGEMAELTFAFNLWKTKRRNFLLMSYFIHLYQPVITLHLVHIRIVLSGKLACTSVVVHVDSVVITFFCWIPSAAVLMYRLLFPQQLKHDMK